jgi:hypothetical protein
MTDAGSDTNCVGQSLSVRQVDDLPYRLLQTLVSHPVTSTTTRTLLWHRMELYRLYRLRDLPHRNKLVDTIVTLWLRDQYIKDVHRPLSCKLSTSHRPGLRKTSRMAVGLALSLSLSLYLSLSFSRALSSALGNHLFYKGVQHITVDIISGPEAGGVPQRFCNCCVRLMDVALLHVASNTCESCLLLWEPITETLLFRHILNHDGRQFACTQCKKSAVEVKQPAAQLEQVTRRP